MANHVSNLFLIINTGVSDAGMLYDEEMPDSFDTTSDIGMGATVFNNAQIPITQESLFYNNVACPAHTISDETDWSNVQLDCSLASSDVLSTEFAKPTIASNMWHTDTDPDMNVLMQDPVLAGLYEQKFAGYQDMAMDNGISQEMYADQNVPLMNDGVVSGQTWEQVPREVNSGLSCPFIQEFIRGAPYPEPLSDLAGTDATYATRSISTAHASYFSGPSQAAQVAPDNLNPPIFGQISTPTVGWESSLFLETWADSRTLEPLNYRSATNQSQLDPTPASAMVFDELASETTWDSGVPFLPLPDDYDVDAFSSAPLTNDSIFEYDDSQCLQPTELQPLLDDVEYYPEDEDVDMFDKASAEREVEEWRLLRQRAENIARLTRHLAARIAQAEDPTLAAQN